MSRNSSNLFLFLFVCLLITFQQTVYSQETFNKRLHFGFSASVLTSIEVTDSCFYATGVALDTISPFLQGALFVKFDLEGNISFSKLLTKPFHSYGMWPNNLTQVVDGDFLLSGTIIDTTGYHAGIIKYNISGDTLFTNKILSPFFPDNPFIASTDMLMNQENELYVLANVSDSMVHTTCYVIKTDDMGNIIWGKTYAVNGLSNSSESITQKSNNEIIIGALKHNINLVTQNFVAQTHLTAIDSTGEILWEYLSPEGELRNYTRSLLPTADGGLLVASGKGVEIIDNQFYSHLRWQNYIFKLDANHEFEWGVDIRDTFPGLPNTLSKLIAPSDQSGYVAVGQVYQKNSIENSRDYTGIITKVSLEGDSLWTRYYHHVSSPVDNHYLYDVEETPDGGFIMVGQATDLLQAAEQPQQRAWIVKVDQHGCLVPGCHLISDISEPDAKAEIQVSLYPNPTSDYLNVYFRHPAMKEKAMFDLVDVSGRSVLQFESGHGDITHVVDVGDLIAGVYFLRCLVDGELVVREVVIGR